MSPAVYIRKAGGETELFDREKLRASIRRSGASAVLANEIADKVEKTITNTSTTEQIYKLAFELLKKEAHRTAVRYSLRRSLSTIGPTGFPFEKYVAKLLEKKGYKTKTDQILQGKCIEHEIDVRCL